MVLHLARFQFPNINYPPFVMVSLVKHIFINIFWFGYKLVNQRKALDKHLNFSFFLGCHGIFRIQQKISLSLFWRFCNIAISK